jgi:phosphatidate cytidylyltransferase
MALHWPTFFTRLGSAIVFSAVMMVGLLWNEWAFSALVAAIMVLCLRDYFRLLNLINGKKSQLKKWAIPIALLGFVAVGFESFYPTGYFDQIGYHQTVLEGSDYLPGGWAYRKEVPKFWTYMNPVLWPIVLCGIVLLLLLGGLSKKSSIDEGLQSVGALAYIMLPCLLLLKLYVLHWAWPLALVLMIWTNDTFAYIVGSYIGKTPFSPISPKKTWEGTAGGVILTIGGAAVWGYYSQKFRIVDTIAVSLCASVAGTAGDLFESKLKRLAGVKDSGTLMPGHGGALDRFDSLLVATPFAFCYLYVIHLAWT